MGKQLCLQAYPHPQQVKIELCGLIGKGTSVFPSQEWVFTEVRSIWSKIQKKKS